MFLSEESSSHFNPCSPASDNLTGYLWKANKISANAIWRLDCRETVRRICCRGLQACTENKHVTHAPLGRGNVSLCVCEWMVVIKFTILSPSTCEEWISAEWQITVSLPYCPPHIRQTSSARKAARMLARVHLHVCVSDESTWPQW